jgi:hypothetical protein
MDENLGRWPEAAIDPTEDYLHGGLVGGVSIRESETVPDQESIVDLDDHGVRFIVVRKKFVDADQAHDVRDPCCL